MNRNLHRYSSECCLFFPERETRQPMGSLIILPRDLHRIIFSKLNVPSILAASRVCRDWRLLFAEEWLWRLNLIELYRQNGFVAPDPPLPRRLGSRHLYLLCYIWAGIDPQNSISIFLIHAGTQPRGTFACHGEYLRTCSSFVRIITFVLLIIC